MISRCFIAGAGEYSGLYAPGEGDYVIAADGGYSELIKRGITPDIVVGDFDSLGSIPDHPNVIRSPQDKDDTDMMLAVKYGLAHGCQTFIIDGGLGGRIDHTYANMQTLTYIANNKARGYLLGRDMSITTTKNSAIHFSSSAKGRVSVFCISGIADGVTLTGLKYQLEEASLTGDYPLGVSNEFIGEPVMISVRRGMLMVMWTGGFEVINDSRGKIC